MIYFYIALFFCIIPAFLFVFSIFYLIANIVTFKLRTKKLEIYETTNSKSVLIIERIILS